MKRKTNIFYKSGIDSNFVTFSNYGENLTGSFLATNIRLFPSKFICLYSPTLEGDFETAKSNIIKGLVGYYENKLAFLRDEMDNVDKINPLGYLLQYIKTNDIGTITYVGDIAEQDYNGTYTDIICTTSVDLNKYKYTIKANTKTKAKQYEDTALYGWGLKDMESIQKQVGNITVKYDKSKEYIEESNSCIQVIQETNQDNQRQPLKFNIIIPLYDYDNLDKEYVPTESVNEIKGTHYKNVPYGMWFGKEVVELKYDSVMKTRPSWSLSLSTQFKPFPYGGFVLASNEQNGKHDAYKATIAEALISQAKLSRNIQEMISNLSSINSRLRTIEAQLSILGLEVDANDVLTDLDNIKGDVKDLTDRVDNLENDKLIIGNE